MSVRRQKYRKIHGISGRSSGRSIGYRTLYRKRAKLILKTGKSQIKIKLGNEAMVDRHSRTWGVSGRGSKDCSKMSAEGYWHVIRQALENLNAYGSRMSIRLSRDLISPTTSHNSMIQKFVTYKYPKKLHDFCTQRPFKLGMFLRNSKFTKHWFERSEFLTPPPQFVSVSFA